MGSPSKWHKGVSKLMSSPSKSISEEQYDDDDDAFEVEAYFQRLKTKTSMKQMWSSKKFDQMVDGDVTPEVSSESDEDLDVKKNLQDVRMDSDEDEMRKDYEVQQSVDENNNNDIGSDDEPLNMMNNIHFAELDLDEPELSQSEQDDDFLPKMRSPKLSEDDESLPKQKLKFFDGDDDDPKTVSELDTSQELSTVQTDGDDEVDGLISEHSVETVPSASVSTTASKHSSSHKTRSKSKSKGDTSKSTSRSHSNRSKHSDSRSSKHERSSSLRSDRTMSEVHESLSESSHSKSATNLSEKTLASHFSGHSKSSLSGHSKSFISGHSKSKTLQSESASHSRSGKHKRTSRSKSSNEPSRKASHEKSQSRHHSDERPRGSGKSRVPRDTGTQTSHHNDRTEDVMGFQYDWQTRGRSNVASHVIDPTTVDVLTSYNPSVLAANDLMKFHMQLLQQHIQDSRKLYESYANENLNSNYKYTTVEDTQKYILKNKPKVISYEEALKKVKRDSDDR